jgi:hypothetical protein
MVKSGLVNIGIVGGTLLLAVGGLTITWSKNQVDLDIAPLVEQACHDEVRRRAPLGHRAIVTSGYHEEGASLAVASGNIEAQYAPERWLQVHWICRINPRTREIARVEVSHASGGQRMKAAASAFQ